MNSLLMLLIPLIAFVLCFSLAILVFLKSQRRRGHAVFILFLCGMALWAWFIFLFRSSPDSGRALFWERAVIPSVCLMAAAFLHFSFISTRLRPLNWVLIPNYLLIVVIGVLGWNELMLEGIGVDQYGYYPITGPLFLLVPLQTYASVTFGMVNFIFGYKRSDDFEEKNAYLYIIIGAACFWLGGLIDLISLITSSIPPIGLIGSIFFCLLASVAILRYHLLDIRFVIRKSTSYLLMSALVALPYAVIYFLADRFLHNYNFALWIYFLAFLLLTLFLQPIWRWAQRVVDRLFYRERYDYLKSLGNFSSQAMVLTELDKIASDLVQLIAKSLQVESVLLLVDSPSQKRFIPLSSYSTKTRTVLDVSILNPGPLTRWLTSFSNVLNLEELDIEAKLRAVPQSERNAFERAGLKLLVPLKSENNLVGIIALSGKISQQPFSTEDRQLLATAQRQIALTMENARLYQELKSSERVLRESEGKLRLMFESLTEGITITNLDGTITQVNKAVMDMHGYGKNGLIGRNVFTLVSEKDRDRAIENLNKKTAGTTEYSLIRKDGSEFPGQVRPAVLNNSAGEPISLVWVSQDVSEFKRMQEQLLANDRLISLGQLVSGIAHELNNPLTGIIGLSELLLEGNVPEDVRRDLRVIDKEAQRTAGIVRNLLAYARRQKTEKRPTSINDAIKTVLELRTFEQNLKNISLDIDLAPELPPVMADTFQLQQVFMNIILNAEYFMLEKNGKGHLTIATKQAGNSIHAIFSDDGPGIASEVKTHLFTPFFTTKPVGKGTGLGLSISYGIIAEHNGKMYAQSEPGKGATFIVELPTLANTQTQG